MATAHRARCGPKSKAALLADFTLQRDLRLAKGLRLTLAEFYEHPDVELHIAAWELEREECAKHGGPRSECTDPEKDWFPQRHICRAEMQALGAQRLYDLLHEEEPYHDGSFERWSKTPSYEYPFRYDDGVSIWASDTDLTPEDDFLEQGIDSAVATHAEQAAEGDRVV